MNPQDAIDRFNALYPSSQPARVFRAPGRVNLIGEHTDYNQGLALPMAIDLSCAVVAAKSRDSCLRAFSNQFQELAKWTPEELERFALRGGWSDRVLGVVWALRQRKIAVEAQNLYIDSEIPLGGGLSSSAALGVALTLALGGPRDPLELTRIAHSAEAGFLGIPCGVLDQFASAHGIAGTALLLDCKILAWEPAPLPPDAVIVAVNSMVKRDLSNSAYGQRVRECSEAAEALGLESLRDATPGDLGRLQGTLLKRARHVITENERVRAFARAARDSNLAEMGRLMDQSHASLRDDYDVSCPELDQLVEIASRVPGVYGSRMTGGGFGGCTISLMRPGAVDSFRAIISAEYLRTRGIAPEIHVCRASQGAAEIAGGYFEGAGDAPAFQ